MKCKHKLFYNVSSTAEKQDLRPMRTPRKPGTVSWGCLQTKAVVSENIGLCMPCQGTGQPWCSWGWRELQWVSPHGDFLPWLWCPHLTPANAPLAPPAPRGHVHVGDAQCPHTVPTWLQTASPAPPHSLWPFCITTDLGKEEMDMLWQ